MFPNSFWKLVSILRPIMERDTAGFEWQGSAWNRVITASQQLSMGLHFLLEEVSTILLAIVVSVLEKFIKVSMCSSMPLISCESFDIVFPDSEDEQQKFADGFWMRSRAGFKNCVGAIDGILVWTDKSSISDLASLYFGLARFYCGCKSKHSLNIQAVCDMNGRFLDIFIRCPGATSDYLAFF